ncbi:ankyrin repeat-containing domain protein [Stachybotrys elegans]|uniref:Ankyrin repeat-containing domain protein n=1 Tax=Stachybotrys elegans TaxID=80388 RepID=A0A8K0SZ50_9HYPO|nr:ankyrin repeat-containing domain protein [Stachybotrys elegans]
MVGFGLECALVPEVQPHIDIICVHGYGATPQTTWHHEKTGKTWIEDIEFVNRLYHKPRVFSFSYNSDISANLSAASIAFHADDLLFQVERLLERSVLDNPIFFIAHGFGGFIVKKAINLCGTLGDRFPRFKRAAAGVVFLGTPHTAVKSDVLLQTVKNAIAAFDDKRIQDVNQASREYTAAISRINKQFLQATGPSLQVLSFWETEATPIKNSSSDCRQIIMVPYESREAMPCNEDIQINCNHVGLAAFNSMFDERFTTFSLEVDRLTTSATFERRVHPPLPIPLRIPPPSPKGYSKAASSRSSSAATNDEEPEANSSKASNGRIADLRPGWAEMEKIKEQTMILKNFMSSLKGWKPGNKGENIQPTPGTCRWFSQDEDFKEWLVGDSWNLMYMAPGGGGKTYLARAISTYLKSLRFAPVVLEFFCLADDPRPAIWDYFTWALIHSLPEDAKSISSEYSTRGPDSPRLESRDVVQIWTNIIKKYSPHSIFLVVDGITYFDDDHFADFWSCLVEIQRNSLTEDNLPTLKAVFTSRMPTDTFARITKPSTITEILSPTTVDDINIYVKNKMDEMDATHDPKDLNRLKEATAGCNEWLYVKFAIAELEQNRRPGAVKFHGNPAGLDEFYDQIFSPFFLDYTKVLGTFLALLTGSSLLDRAFTLDEAEDAICCLHGISGPVSLERSMVKYLNHLVWFGMDEVVNGNRTVFTYLKNRISPNQAANGMALACLRYLLQDRFAYPPSPPEEGLESFVESNPFYDYASKRWVEAIEHVEEFDPQLELLLKTFLSGGCPQYQTWIRLWMQPETPFPKITPEDHPVLPLIFFGAWRFFDHFFPIPQASSWSFSSTLRGVVETTRQFFKPVHQEPYIPAPIWPSLLYHGEPILIVAAWTRQARLVEFLLKRGVDANSRGWKGRRALVECIVRQGPPEHHINSLATARCLLAHGADPNAGSLSGNTPLLEACTAGNLELARLLIDHGANIETGDIHGFTPLHEAFQSRNVLLVEDLVQRGAEVGILTKDLDQLLMASVRTRAFPMFRILLPRVVDVNAMYRGVTVLHLASGRANRIEFLRLLLERPDIDLDLGIRVSALKFAVESRNHRGAELLLNAGAFPGRIRGHGSAPLLAAIGNHDMAMVELLLAHGAPVNDFDPTSYSQEKTRTALAAAVAVHNEAIIRLLLRHGADPTFEQGHNMRGPLCLALSEPGDDTRLLELLLNSPIPVDVNFIPPTQKHPLVVAAEHNHKKAVQLLLKHGADTSIWTETSPTESPLHHAAKRGFVDVCVVLLEHDPNLINACFESDWGTAPPLDAACMNGQASVVSLFLEKGALADTVSGLARESPLNRATRSGLLETIKLILTASPEMVNVSNIWGVTPLHIACDDVRADIVKLLLEAGADFAIEGDTGLYPPVGRLVSSKKHGVDEVLDLMIQHGLDLRAYTTKDGRSLLHIAIQGESLRNVRSLLERGVDPLQCTRSMVLPNAWSSAIGLAFDSENIEMIELLLEPRWGLREDLAGFDEMGLTILGRSILSSSPSRGALAFVKCDELRRETGRDVFSDLANHKHATGLAPRDFAIGSWRVSESAHSHTDQVLLSLVERVLNRPRTLPEHRSLLGFISKLLIQRCICAEETASIISKVLSEPDIVWDEHEAQNRVSMSVGPCRYCRDIITDTCNVCRLCFSECCDRCFDREPPPARLHRHDWFYFPVAIDVDLNSDDVQSALEGIHNSLSDMRESAEGHGAGEPSRDPEEERAQAVAIRVQQGLQLATLHAFNLLAVRKSAFTPYLSLASSTEELMAPFNNLIAPRRRALERRNLAYECSAWRCWEEWQYFSRGLQQAHADEDMLRKDAFLAHVPRLFNESDRSSWQRGTSVSPEHSRKRIR